MTSHHTDLTTQHKDLTTQHKDLTSHDQHNYLTSSGRNMPQYSGKRGEKKVHFINKK